MIKIFTFNIKDFLFTLRIFVMNIMNFFRKKNPVPEPKLPDTLPIHPPKSNELLGTFVSTGAIGTSGTESFPVKNSNEVSIPMDNAPLPPSGQDDINGIFFSPRPEEPPKEQPRVSDYIDSLCVSKMELYVQQYMAKLELTILKWINELLNDTEQLGNSYRELGQHSNQLPLNLDNFQLFLLREKIEELIVKINKSKFVNIKYICIPQPNSVMGFWGGDNYLLMTLDINTLITNVNHRGINMV